MATNSHLVFVTLTFVSACCRSVFSTADIKYPYDEDEGKTGICFWDKVATSLYVSNYVPQCSSLTSYNDEQTDGHYSWCSSPDGKFIPHTLDFSAIFPYNCKKTLKCPGYLVYETTGRCELTCNDAYERDGDSNDTLYDFFCRNMCICPREMYKNSRGECVTARECQKEIFSCPKPKVFARCGSRCPATCETPKPKKCQLECNENLHCVCPENMVQVDVRNRTCVKLSKCPKCKGGAVYSPCAPSCPETCPTTDDGECKPVAGCKPGCTCPPGYVQLSSDGEISCVERHKCPRRCPAPQVYRKCASACPATCENPNPKRCTKECRQGMHCVCGKDYVQVNKYNTTCVKQKECKPRCEKPKVYDACSSLCPPTCGEPNPKVCSRACNVKVTCVCPRGMVQPDADTLTCIEPSDCPVKCIAPKLYAKCASFCPPTCKNQHPKVCSRACNVKVTCVCPPGMVQPDVDTLTCIYPSECPEYCEKPKVFMGCPSNCQPTCDDPSPKHCNRGCAKDKCVCPRGLLFVSLDDRRCVEKGECPVKCEANKVYDRCPTVCPRTCKHLKPRSCTRQCGKDKCVCPDGMVFLSMEHKICLKEDECPKDSEVKCIAPKVHERCPTACPRTCGNPKPPLTCSPECAEDKCICPEDMVLLSLSNKKCVKEKKCPSSKEDICKEQKPKVFDSCATHCPLTCDDPKPRFCSRACNPKVKCVCPPGMVQLDELTRTCVYLEQCPKKCKYPLARATCATKCPPTCDNPTPTCQSVCQTDVKCQCSKGFLQLSSKDKKCVLPSECPNLRENCPKPKRPTRCASSCPPTCADPSPKDCPKPCNPDITCECPEGMVQNSLLDDTCVWPIRC